VVFIFIGGGDFSFMVGGVFNYDQSAFILKGSRSAGSLEISETANIPFNNVRIGIGM